jgi:hypothetical protein
MCPAASINSPTALIAFHRLDTKEKLLWPVEMQTRMIIAEQEALNLAAQLAAYKARFGSLDF